MRVKDEDFFAPTKTDLAGSPAKIHPEQRLLLATVIQAFRDLIKPFDGSWMTKISAYDFLMSGDCVLMINAICEGVEISQTDIYEWIKTGSNLQIKR